MNLKRNADYRLIKIIPWIYGHHCLSFDVDKQYGYSGHDVAHCKCSTRPIDQTSIGLGDDNRCRYVLLMSMLNE